MSDPANSSAYSLPRLLNLIAGSIAYEALTSAEKSNIQDHIRLNNTPVLIYVYEKLQQEAQANQLSRDRLAKKIFRLSLSPSAKDSLQQELASSSFSAQNLV